MAYFFSIDHHGFTSFYLPRNSGDPIQLILLLPCLVVAFVFPQQCQLTVQRHKNYLNIQVHSHWGSATLKKKKRKLHLTSPQCTCGNDSWWQYLASVFAFLVSPKSAFIEHRLFAIRKWQLISLGQLRHALRYRLSTNWFYFLSFYTHLWGNASRRRSECRSLMHAM